MNERITLALPGGIEGRVTWRLVNPGGDVAAHGQQANLLLDRFFASFFGAAQSLCDTNVSGEQYTTGLRQYVCVGTASTAPAEGQTTLGAEVARSGSSGGFAPLNTFTTDAPNRRVIGEFSITRVIDFTQAYNLPEFGLSDASSGQITIRELFRDGGGTPLTLAVQAGQQLQLTHTLRIALPYAADLAATVTITGLGTFDAKTTFFNVGNTLQAMFAYGFNPAASLYARPMTAANTGDHTTQGGAAASGSGNSPARVSDPYVTGQFRRTGKFVWTTSMANVATYGWLLQDRSPADNNNPTAGFKITLVSPASFTKTSTKKLTLEFELSLSRGIA